MKNNIRFYREKLGWTQARLAQQIGSTAPQITRLESSQRKLTPEWIDRLAKALGVHPTSLIDWDGHAAAPPGLGDGLTKIRHDAAETIPVYGGLADHGEAILMGREIARISRHPAQSGYLKAFAVQVPAETMAPRYWPGETAFALAGQPPRLGQDCLLELQDGTALLRVFERRTAEEVICGQLNPLQNHIYKMARIKALHCVVGRG